MTKAGIPWNVNQAVKAYQNGSIRFDNAIQRGIVWDRKRMSLLIDTILRGYTIPPVYLIKTNEQIKTPKGMVSVYDCIDGKQRCTALAMFLNNEYALEGLEPFLDGSEDVDLNGKTFAELNEDMQDTIKSYGITFYYFTDITDDEVSEMMSRMNNGKALTGVENARIKAKDLNSIIKLAEHPLFVENLTESAIRSYANEDIVIKTYMQAFEKNTALSSANVRKVYESLVVDEDTKDKLTKILDKAYEVIEIIKESCTKKIIKKVLTKTNLVAILNLCGNNLDKDNSLIAIMLEQFFAPKDKPTISDEYNEAMTNGTNHAGNVDMRNTVLAEYLENMRELNKKD